MCTYIENCYIVKYVLFIATLGPYLCLCVCVQIHQSAAHQSSNGLKRVSSHLLPATGGGQQGRGGAVVRAEALVNIVLNFK